MAGQYLNNYRVKASIQNWMNTIIPPNGKWEGNNLHIDEIESLSEIEKFEWINISFLVLNIIMNQFKPFDSLILFLHIDLKYSAKSTPLDRVS